MIYIASEGDIYTIETAPDYLNQDNWLSDWAAFDTTSPDRCLQLAAVFDSCILPRPRTASERKMYRKLDAMRDRKAALQTNEAMTVAQILATHHNNVITDTFPASFD